ncbi:MAG: hypothetical protein ABS46_15685 [Cytophagaceae bacterium SCN 52-12]|nr:MAG: hypothetical protein ABS46_15685 [Cytophagaceae bacterium SCN 52-12]
MSKGFGVTLSLLSVTALPAAAQEKDNAAVRYELEAAGMISTGKTLPFWMRTNQYGEVPLESGIVSFRGQLRKDYEKRDGKKNRFSYGYGLRGVANVGRTNELLLPEIYGKIRFGAFELYGGRRRETMGLADSTLSSGSYIWSGNALPVPKIQISIPYYTPILKSGLIAVKGNFAHGWFGNDIHTKNYWLHQKSLYVRLGKPEWHFKMHAGMNHQAQWGGKPAEPYVSKHTGQLITKYATNMSAFLNTVFGIPVPPDEDPDRFGEGSLTEGGNRLGNHLGTVDVALEYDSPKANILLYRQSIYEDGSLYYLSNIKDGLNGISITRKGASQGILKLVVEYLYTMHQGGDQGSGYTIPELRGRDNYFYNTIYKDGWTYKRQTLGTPFIMPLEGITGMEPNISDTNRSPNRIVNNRVKALMVAMQSRAGIFDLTTRLSFSENLGAYVVRFPASRRQTSIQQTVSFPIRSLVLQTGLFYDQGELLEKNLGLSLAVKKVF